MALLAALVGASGCGGAGARYQAHLHNGQQYLAAGNLDKASVEFRNAAQIQHKSAAPLYWNGRVAELRGDIRQALGLYQAALDAEPGYLDARTHLAKMLVFAGAPQPALDLLATEGTPQQNAGVLSVKASAHHQLKDEQTARTEAEQAVRLAPESEDALSVLAALYAAANEYPRAIELIGAASARRPAVLELHEVLVNLYLGNAQPAKAEEQMRQIIRLRPHDLSARAQLARHLERAQRLDDAQAVLDGAVRELTRERQVAQADAARLLLVEFVARSRSRAEGERTLRGFLQQQPDNLDLRLGLGALLTRNGASKEAAAEYEEILRRGGSSPKAAIARDRLAAIKLAQGDLAGARSLIAQVLSKNNRDADALALRAALEMRDNDPAGAIADLRALLRDQPNVIGLQRELARAYLAKGEMAMAEEALRSALQVAPDDLNTKVQLAELLGQTHRSADAVALLAEQVHKFPESTAAREALLNAHLRWGELSAAREDAQELKKREPSSTIGFYYAGIIAARQQRFADSEENLRQGLRLQPDSLPLLRALADVQADHGEHAAAIDTLQGALRASPQDVSLLNLLGNHYLRSADYPRAAQTLHYVIERAPMDWEAHRDLARVLGATGDNAGAFAEYRTALQLAPGDAALVSGAATFCEQHGRVDQAIAAYEGLYRKNPAARIYAANNLAMLLITYNSDRGSLDRARDLTRDFVSSADSSLLDTAGWVSFKRGEYQEALPTLQRALSGARDSPVIRYHLGMTQLKVGQLAEARANLEFALHGTADFAGSDEARIALAALEPRAG